VSVTKNGTSPDREALLAAIQRFLREVRGGADPARRDALLAEVARWQAEHVPVVGRLAAARRARFDAGPDGWPALPTDVFRFARVCSHDPADDVRVFRTSGTTSGARGVHAFRDLRLYDLAASLAASHALFRGRRMRLVIVAPRPHEAPDSSLSYMLGRFEAWFATQAHWIWNNGAIDLDEFENARAAGEPIALLGTSFALVHLCDALGEVPRPLPECSLVMQTGGLKGRSRQVAPAQMRAMLSACFAVPLHRIVSEYGMTELSSQMYGRGILDGAAHEPERLWVPGWVRATPVDPETLRPVPEGEPGLLRIDDLANLDSVCSIQTADLARREGDSIVLLGRAPGATPRGCSLAIEEALGGAGGAG
jgi:hypothetical protein